MKRSTINKYIQTAKRFLNSKNQKLPPFAYWTPEEWAQKGKEYNEIRECMLGWDVTDFGSGDFKKCGLLLFTTRNGRKNDIKYQKTYAQKYLIVQSNQITPYHFHWEKVEDIINIGGGTLMVQLYNSDKGGELLDTDVEITVDGKKAEISAGDIVEIKPGESITLLPYQYHQFWAEGGTTLLMEVSAVNDDETDNRFYDAPGRFPKIEEDELPVHLLVTDYTKTI